MPVIATPVTISSSTGLTIADLNVVAPEVTHVEGLPAYSRKQTARINQGQTTTLRWQLRDRNTGKIIDLSLLVASSGSASSDSSSASVSDSAAVSEAVIKFRASEATRIHSTLMWACDATIVEATQGLVQLILPSSLTERAGLFSVEWGIFDVTGESMLYSVQGWLWINRGEFGLGPSDLGLPSVDSLRGLLRDSDPTDNYLRASVEFDLTEYSEASLRAIQRFNSRPPAISRLRASSITFPDSAQLQDAILAELYLISAAWYRRNHLSYQAAGVTVDDMNKAADYERIGIGLQQKFDAWAGTIKKAANARAFMGTMNSPYVHTGTNTYL